MAQYSQWGPQGKRPSGLDLLLVLTLLSRKNPDEIRADMQEKSASDAVEQAQVPTSIELSARLDLRHHLLQS
ncbi:MAG: hypothetical protein JOY67_02985 [Hyphomicrobiales bacterium]|nr:hypothetical protein [Hyphomicrobiales bacterium]